MPNIKSSKKAIKVIAKKTKSNHDYTAKAKNYVKKCNKAILNKETDLANETYKKVQKSIDSAVAKGAVKKNTAARTKSRLTAKIKNI